MQVQKINKRKPGLALVLSFLECSTEMAQFSRTVSTVSWLSRSWQNRSPSFDSTMCVGCLEGVIIISSSPSLSLRQT